jgi:1-acyl-sn-glycerol-3-phosphate acyltransferase
MLILIRSFLFDILFFTHSFLCCFLGLPLLLGGQNVVLGLVKYYTRGIYVLEKYVLGLDYEVRGLEHVPNEGPFIVAAKHQSSYETFKLYRLFHNPTIVLKKELLNIPLWGRFMASMQPIALDRSQGKDAMKKLCEAAVQAKNDGRTIVIYPQGTRVYPWQTSSDKPYKGGIIRMQQDTELPIVPLATNSGMFWPRKSWLKKPGKVIFEYLPVMPPVVELSDLEKVLETASLKLQDEAVQTYKHIHEPRTPRKKDKMRKKS